MPSVRPEPYRLQSQTERDRCAAHLHVMTQALFRLLGHASVERPCLREIAYHANSVEARQRLIRLYDEAQATA